MNESDPPCHPEHTLPEHTLAVQQQFMKHQQALLAYVLSLVPNLQDAQDIVQDVFLVVSRKAATWTDGTNFMAWACAIARYETLRHQRSTKGRGVSLNADVLEMLREEGPVDDDLLLQIDRLKDCLKRLPPRTSELVLLRYHAGQMPEAIAVKVNWSVNAVRVALTRAKQSLRACMEHRVGWEERR